MAQAKATRVYGIRLPTDIHQRLADFRKRLEEERPGVAVTFADALRHAVTLGLERAFEADRREGATP